MAVTISGSTGIDIGAGNLTLPDDTTMSSTNGMGATLVRSGAISNAYNITHSHGQSGAPDMVWAELHITSAHSNYAVGDVIKVFGLYEEDENDHALTVYGNATQLGLSQTGTDEVYRVSNKTSGALASIASGSCDIKLVGVWF